VQRLLLLGASQFQCRVRAVSGVSQTRRGVDPVEFSRPEIAIWSIGIPPGVGGRGVPIFPLILNIPRGLVPKNTLLYRGYAHICWTEKGGKPASQPLGKCEALRAEFPPTSIVNFSAN